MTDKEKAEEYVNALLDKDDTELDKFLDENLGDLQLNIKQAGTLLGLMKGIGICSHLAGLAEGRKEKWHDLRKDPNDLPKENGKYIVHIKVSEKTSITDTWSFFNGYFGQYVTPIAWCELPKFEE